MMSLGVDERMTTVSTGGVEVSGEEVVSLRDGTPIVVRPIRRDDAVRLERLFYRLSPTTLYRRFFTLVDHPEPAVVQHLVDVDHDRRLAFVAVVDDEIVGVARCDRLPGGSDADTALVTADAWQRRGVATVLLQRLAVAAHARGITALVGTVLGENRPVLRLVRRLSADTRIEAVDGEYRFRVPLPTAA